MDLDRLERLSNRILAIKMAIDGADFVEVYEFFWGLTENAEQSFENTRRVFRGGVLTGGAPFTKDCVYLDGLLRVHNFLRVAAALGRVDLIHNLFVGKLDIDDIAAIGELRFMNICQPSAFLPPWVSDLRFLLSYLSYSTFLNQIDLVKIR